MSPNGGDLQMPCRVRAQSAVVEQSTYLPPARCENSRGSHTDHQLSRPCVPRTSATSTRPCSGLGRLRGLEAWSCR